MSEKKGEKKGGNFKTGIYIYFFFALVPSFIQGWIMQFLFPIYIKH